MSKLTIRQLYDVTKEHLTNYPFYKTTIERKKEELEEILVRLEGVNATDYSKDKVTSSPTGDMLNNILVEKFKTEEMIRRLENICKNIDGILEKLPPKEKAIITMYYLETNIRNKKTWVHIARKVHYSVSHCRRLRDEAIEKIMIIFDD